jgi:hypothetical protein
MPTDEGRWRRPRRDEQTGVLPARIDKYLVLPAPGLSHRAAAIGGPSTPLIDGRFDHDRHWLERLIYRDETNQQMSVKWSALLPSDQPNGDKYSSPGTVSALRYLSGWAVELMFRQERRVNCSSGRPAPPPRS